MTAPERLETERLILRRPLATDAQAIFSRYSSDPEVTRYLGWPLHASIDDALGFVHFSNLEWQRWPAGPYLIESRANGALLGSTGLSFETPYRAATGYVLARDAWGLGYATEALRAMKSIAASTSLYRLYALCHPAHEASQHVLEKCGFLRESVLKGYAEFPNLRLGEPCDVVCYTCMLRPV